jgi:hypothetical protein
MLCERSFRPDLQSDALRSVRFRRDVAMSSVSKDGLVFGIYPGGEVGSDDGIASGPPD